MKIKVFHEMVDTGNRGGTFKKLEANINAWLEKNGQIKLVSIGDPVYIEGMIVIVLMYNHD